MIKDLKTEYSSHLQKKMETFQTCLEELGCSGICRSIVPSPVEAGYRNRAKFKIYRRGKNTSLRGTDPMRGEIPWDESLWILPEWGRSLVRSVGDCLLRSSEANRVDGFEVKLSHGREEGYINLSVKPEPDGVFDQLAEEMLGKIDGLVGLAVPSHNKEYGEIFLRHHLLDLEIFCHFSVFFQSNLHLTPQLVETVRSFFEGKRFRRLYDLYCGAGLFSLFLRKTAQEIFGVDNSIRAVESANKNAGRLEMSGIRFICADIHRFVERRLDSSKTEGKDLFLLNPPRSGVPSPVICAVASQQADRICLVSCCFETHVHDLLLWNKTGYEIESMAAFDMFPFTDFIETVTILKRR